MIDPLILLRAVHIAATALASGTVCFMVLVAEPAFHLAKGGSAAGLAGLRRRWNLTVWIALAVAVVSGAGWLALLAADIYGAPIIEVCLHGGVWSVLTETRFGLVWIARLALTPLLAVLTLWPQTRALQLAAAAAMIALLAFVGHAGATPGTAGQIHLASDVVHLIAAAAWLGSLPALVMLLSRARHAKGSALRTIAAGATRRFSVLGILSVGALLASGLINSWNLLAGPRDLITSDYGRLLALKVGLFVAMVGIAAVNRYYLTPRLAAAGAMRALERNTLGETALGLFVLLFVGALGTMAPSGHVHIPSSQIPPDAAFVHIHTEEAMAEVTIDPGRSGRINASIRVLREDFSDYPAKTVQLAFDPPSAGSKIARNAAHMPDGTWQVNALDLPYPGIWTVRVTIAGERGAPIVLDAPVMIDR